MSQSRTLDRRIISAGTTGFPLAPYGRIDDDVVEAVVHPPPPALFLTNPRMFRWLCDSSYDDNLSMRLMEHYVAQTSVELVPPADSDPDQRSRIIYASTLYPFLQHALLAISGLHLCRTISLNRQYYYHAACFHAVEASRLFCSGVTNINAQNWTPIAAFIINSTIFNFDISFLGQTSDNSSQSISPASIIRILRAPRALYHGFHPLIFSLPSASVLIHKLRQRRFPLDEGVMSAIDSLEVFSATKSNAASGLVCTTTIQTLRRWASFVSCQPRMWVHFFSWPAEVSDEYVVLLESGCALASVIFVYWCAIMNRAPPMYYLTGTMNMLATLGTSNCDSEFDEVLQWPRNELELR